MRLRTPTGESGERVAVPCTFLIDGNGTIRLANVDADYKRRLDPDDVIGTLKELNGKSAGRTAPNKGIKQIAK